MFSILARKSLPMPPVYRLYLPHITSVQNVVGKKPSQQLPSAYPFSWRNTRQNNFQNPVGKKHINTIQPTVQKSFKHRHIFSRSSWCFEFNI